MAGSGGGGVALWLSSLVFARLSNLVGAELLLSIAGVIMSG